MPFQEGLHGRPCSHNILQYRNGWNFVHLRFPHQLSLPSQLPFHGKMADQLAHSVMSVYHSRNRCLKNNFRFRLGMNSPLLDSFMVTNHSLHSVALDPIQISSQKNIFNDASFFLRKAKRFKKHLRRNGSVCHNSILHIP